MLRRLVTCALTVAACASWATACPVKVIFDTDMIGDYDDVGAMAVLHKLADQGECEILATVSSTHSNASAGTVELLNAWYGRPDIPVGAVKGAGVGGGSEKHRSHIKYERLLAKYPKLWRHRNANDAPDATDVYRRVLSAQPDGSVTICTVGFLTNLRRLLQSKPDRHSPLDGRTLVKRKVKVWYVMGWKIPKGRECNIMNDPESARYALENWPTPIVIDDFNYSQYIYAGRKVAALPDDGNPVRDIFAWCMPPAEKCPAAAEIIPTGRFKDNVKEGHNCFDQSCVLAAVRGVGSFFDVEKGRMTMVGDKGDNLWTPDPNGPHARMVGKWPRERIAALIDDLMAAAPDAVPPEKMKEIYETVKTPYKRGMVLTPEKGEMLDNPSVFRHKGDWYMIFIRFDGKGYETHLAKSDDLVRWQRLGCIFQRGEKGAWDASQADGWPSLADTRWDGPNTLNTFNGRYWMMYLGGAKDGYETDPLSTGVAWTDDPSAVKQWTRCAGNPVLQSSDPAARAFERATIYKHFTVEDPSRACGGRFVNFYNAADKVSHREAIGMAVSDDMLHWRRVGDVPVIENGDPRKHSISGDPMFRRIGDLWVMFYFGYQWRPGGAFDTFACSYDLKHWTKWDGEPLIKPSADFDRGHAHKPWVLKHDGVVYHYYCAVGNKGRGIALATSAPTAPAEPSAEELVDRAKAAPSLMFRAADLSAIRRRLAEDPDAKAWWEGFRKTLDANVAKGVKVPPCGAQWYHWYSCRKCGAQLRGESPTRHVCAKCGEVHSGWPYDDAYWFPIQHRCGSLVRDAGVAWAITGERRYADVAKGLLLDYAKVYLSWPRHDNWSKATDRNPDAARAFSQVLDESVWMIDLVRGFDAISGTLTEEERQTIFARVFRPAADIIYMRDDVGRPILGNHQCWHLSAYALAALVMGDVARVRESIDGLSGWKYQLSRGILEDGCWYEGAWGYQFYTMSSLAPYFTALRNLGYEPPAAFKRLFDSPFGQLAPDWFLPAVNDTARVRFAPGALADLYEQAWTWWGDPQHGWWLAQQPRRTMAYALWGRPARKDAAFTPPVSQNFRGSGLAVLRSRSPAAKGPLPDNMLAMDYGPHGGWHGHHDKLQLLLWGRGRMWGEDPGCIAYGNPRHWGWYRSTLAHNTLAMDGRNQAPAQGRLVGYVAGGNAAVVAADSGEAYPGATVRRATALVDDIVLDFAEVSADSAHEWEWAFHARGKQETSVTNGVAVPTAPPEIDVRDRRKVEAAQHMDHWLWVEDVREGAHDGTWHSVWRQGGDVLHLFQKSPAGMLRTGTGPAQPPPEKFRLAVNCVAGGRRLAFRTVMTLDGSADVQIGDEIARNGWRGFSATVGGRRFELTVNGENVRLVEKDGTGKAVRDLAAKR